MTFISQLDPDEPLDFISGEMERQAEEIDAPASPVVQSDLEKPYLDANSVAAERQAEQEREELRRSAAGLYQGGGELTAKAREEKPGEGGAAGSWGTIGPVEQVPTKDGGFVAMNRVKRRDGSEVLLPALGDPGWEETNWGRKFRAFVSGEYTSLGDMIQGIARKADAHDLGRLGQHLIDMGDAMAVPDPEFADQVAGAFGSSAAFYLPGLGTTAATNVLFKASTRVASWLGTTVSSVLEASAEGNAVYREAISQGMGAMQANQAADRTFWMNMPLLMLSYRFGLFADEGGPLRHLKSAMGEGYQEGMQDLIQATNLGQDVRIKDVARSMLIGGIVGGGASYLSDGVGRAEDRAMIVEDRLKAGKPLEPEGVYDIHDAFLLGIMPETEYKLARHYEDAFEDADYQTMMGVVHGIMSSAADLQGLGTAIPEGVDTSKLVKGTTSTYAEVNENWDMVAGDSLLLLYEGRDKDGKTLVHEVNHRVFHHLPDQTRAAFAEWLGDRVNDYQDIDEAYAQNATEFFFKQRYNRTIAGGAFARTNAAIYRMIARAEVGGAPLTPAVREAFMESVKPRLSQGKVSMVELEAYVGMQVADDGENENLPAAPGQAPKLGPVFYSKLEQFLAEKSGRSAPVRQVLDLLQSKAATTTLRDEEVEWSGMRNWLQLINAGHEGKGRVTRDEMLNFLRDNQVRVREVIQGEPTPITPEQQAQYDKDMEAYNQRLEAWRQGRNPEAVVDQNATDLLYVWENNTLDADQIIEAIQTEDPELAEQYGIIAHMEADQLDDALRRILREEPERLGEVARNDPTLESEVDDYYSERRDSYADHLYREWVDQGYDEATFDEVVRYETDYYLQEHEGSVQIADGSWRDTTGIGEEMWLEDVTDGNADAVGEVSMELGPEDVENGAIFVNDVAMERRDTSSHHDIEDLYYAPDLLDPELELSLEAPTGNRTELEEGVDYEIDSGGNIMLKRESATRSLFGGTTTEAWSIPEGYRLLVNFKGVLTQEEYEHQFENQIVDQAETMARELVADQPDEYGVGTLYRNNETGWTIIEHNDHAQLINDEGRHVGDYNSYDEATDEHVNMLIHEGDYWGETDLHTDGERPRPTPPVHPGKVNTKEVEWNEYMEPGREKGSDRNILMTWANPPAGTTYRHMHFRGEQNFLAHLRANTRTATDGTKVFYIEELQSDWHQQGRRYGYEGRELTIPTVEKGAIGVARLLGVLPEEVNFEEDIAPGGESLGSWSWLPDKDYSVGGAKARAGEPVMLIPNKDGSPGYTLEGLEITKKAPDAPYKGTGAWTALLMKRAIRYASEHGHDAIAWTPGVVQAQRWRTILWGDVKNVNWTYKPPPSGPEAQGRLDGFKDRAQALTELHGDMRTREARMGDEFRALYDQLRAEGVDVHEAMRRSAPPEAADPEHIERARAMGVAAFDGAVDLAEVEGLTHNTLAAQVRQQADAARAQAAQLELAMTNQFPLHMQVHYQDGRTQSLDFSGPNGYTMVRDNQLGHDIPVHISDAVGKALTENLMEAVRAGKTGGEFNEGTEIKESSGHYGYYDKMVPNEVKRLIKPYKENGKAPQLERFALPGVGRKVKSDEPVLSTGFRLNEAMRNAALFEGFTSFQLGEDTKNQGTQPGTTLQELNAWKAHALIMQRDVQRLRNATPDGELVRADNLKARLAQAKAQAKANGETLLSKGGVDAFKSEDWADFINFNRIGSEDDVKALVARMYEMDPDYWQNEVKGHRPWKLVEKQADTLGMSPFELMARRKGSAFNDVEMEVLRRAAEGASVKLAELRDTVLSAPTGQADAARAAFLAQSQLVYALQETMMDAKATAARALAILRKQAQPNATAGAAMIQMLAAAKERGLDPDAAAKALLDIKDPGQIMAAVRTSYKVTGWDMLLEMRQTGLLWSPWTHARNLIGNGLAAFWLVGERQVAGAMPGSEVGVGEAAHMFYGMFQGALDGLRMARYSLQKDAPSTGSEKYDPRIYGAIGAQGLQDLKGPFGSIAKLRQMAPQATSASGWLGRAFDYFGKATRLTYQALGAEDAFFRGVAERMELHALAYRMARTEAQERGLTGDQAKEYRANRMASIQAEPENHPEIKMAVEQFGHYATFTNELGTLGKQMMRASYNQKGGQFIRLLAPFVRTPINLMKFTAHRLPVLNTLAPTFWADYQAGGARRESAMARVSLSWLLFGLVGYLVFDDRLTGDGPKNRRIRDGWKETGWRPNSVRVGNTLHSFDNTDPVGAIIGMQANFWELMRWSIFSNDFDWEGVAAAAVLSPTKYMMSQTYLRGVAEFMSMATESEDRVGDPGAALKTSGARWLQNTALTFVPFSSGLRHATRMTDPSIRATETMLDRLKAMTPGWSTTLPVVRGLWGQPLQRDEMLGLDIISPIGTSKIGKDPLDRLVAENQMRLYMPGRLKSRDGAQVRLTPEQYAKMLDLMFEPGQGQAPLRERVKAAVFAPGAQRLSAVAKEEIINDMRREAADAAFDALLRTDGDLRKVLQYQAAKNQAIEAGQIKGPAKVAPPAFK